MAFGRIGNRHDQWAAFCNHHRESLTTAGLPQVIVQSEPLFRDLLRDGTASGRGASASLVELSPTQWAGLAKFVAVFFLEFESFAPLDLFPAYRREAERRWEAERRSAIEGTEPDIAADKGT